MATPMFTYRLIAVNADGYGETYFWGDTYEVEAPDYLTAKNDVLGRIGTDGKRSYAKILKGWAQDCWGWAALPVCSDCGSAVGETEWAGTGRVICWDCCGVRQSRTR